LVDFDQLLLNNNDSQPNTIGIYTPKNVV